MKKIYIICALIAGLGLQSCLNDDFLERKPLDKQTEETVFTTYENFRTYAWQFYTYIEAHAGPTSFEGGATGKGIFDTQSDNAFYGNSNNENKWVWQTVTVPSTTNEWTNPYKRIRAINILLGNIETSEMNESDQRHWRSVAYFFKANEYYRLISFFGSAIWIEKTINETDEEVLYGNRMPRLELAAKVLEMLSYSKENINPDGDGENTITRDVVCALISRFGLFEGTWQRYHGLSDGTTYLNASYNASAELLQKHPEVHSHYDELFNSEELRGVKGVLLYKNFLSDSKGHNMSRYVRTSSHYFEISSEAVAAYLCQDGKPIYTSELFEGDKNTGDADIYTEFRNRDYRLYYNVCPPYKVNTPTPTSMDLSTVTYTDNPEDREFIDLMARISGTAGSSKTLPALQWAGQILREMPHFRDNKYNMGQGYMASYGGYYTWKYYNKHTPAFTANGDNSTDYALFRMGEVMVNHAEAAWELGKFDQATADATINKLRIRANVAPMKVTDITSTFDPKRDQTVDAVLWEIRRERRIELMFEGYRNDDLRRWKKAEYMNKQQLGIFMKKSDLEDERHVGEGADINNFKLTLDRQGNEGRIVYFTDPVSQGKGWLNHYYLHPLPIDELLLNTNLKQNEGYPATNAE